MRLYVGNLPSDLTDAQLNELFRPFGATEPSAVIVRTAKGQSRGFGFAVLPDPVAARAAIAGLDGKIVNGRALKVDEASQEGTTLASASR